ncbi:DnaJ domain-containing protein [Synechococcus sp. PCC 7336]|uniref:DnaJ domain-containing protein n=1 Tax=Synechococcus sp. PCC 7336 TaxID=195250 RepID=UPI00034D1CE5|nr:DnaJ domain-containing protein [Synechococcus sp. PCC 7336]
MPADTHYERLGVPLNANLDEIKTAYRRLARELHPDKLPDNLPFALQELARREYGLLREAYLVLSNAKARATYDRQLAERFAAEYPQVAHSVPGPRRHRLHPRGGWNWQWSVLVALAIVALATTALALGNGFAFMLRRTSEARSATAEPSPNAESAPAKTTPASRPARLSETQSASAARSDDNASAAETAAVAEDEFSPGEITRFATVLLEFQSLRATADAALETAQTSEERRQIEATFEAGAAPILASYDLSPELFQQIAHRAQTDAKLRLAVSDATSRLQRLRRR